MVAQSPGQGVQRVPGFGLVDPGLDQPLHVQGAEATRLVVQLGNVLIRPEGTQLHVCVEGGRFVIEGRGGGGGYEGCNKRGG